ncbi:MAG: Hpt domain-containing protein, partial [Desulfobacterium sp.]
DFKKDYGDHPEYLKNLLKQKDFKKIRECAHTIKGISGYMAAEELFKRATALEDHLRVMDIKDPPQPESTAPPRAVDVSLVHGFINEIKTMMNTLGQLPVKTVQPPCPPLKPGEKRPLKPRQSITELDKQKQKILKEFHALLVKGEFMATDLLPGVEKILKDCGYERELRTIMDLMDDIEFEQAADKMKDWF